jgi:hypothetical protein
MGGDVARLAVARGDQIDAIYAESHALWGAGLTRDDYRALWHDLAGTIWGRRYSRFLVLTDDDGAVLSSVKVYRPAIRLLKGTGRAAVLGAIFTPAHRRGRGHASSMLEHALGEAAGRGDLVALLFSDIGQPYYERAGFAALPAEEHWARLPRALAREPDGLGLRPLREEDLEPMSRAHEACNRGRAFALVRDAAHWRFLWTRTRSYFERLADPHVVPLYRVAWSGGSFVGYIHSIEGRGEWNVREIGAADGTAETMERILRAGARLARRTGLKRFYGWLPPELAGRLTDWPLCTRRRTRAVPMIRALDDRIDLSSLQRPGAAYFPFQDQF